MEVGPDPSLILPVAHASGTAASVDLPLLLMLAAVAVGWTLAVRSIARAHPRNRFPAWRTVAFMTAILTLVLALQSPIATYADEAFSVHMVQHMLLSFVAAPLTVMAGPILLVLRAAPGPLRTRLLLPVLQSRPVRLLTHPLLTWTAFGAIMWALHFSPLLELALESQPVHELEHVTLLVAGVAYWLPAIGSEPMPVRLGWSGRFLYMFLGMPVGSMLGLLLAAQTAPLSPTYVAAATDAAAALADQRVAGTIMWLGSDFITFALLGLVAWSWVRSEAARMRRHSIAPGG